MVTFDTNIPVRLDGKVVGHIKEYSEGGYYYQPKGTTRRGEIYPTVEQVKRTLIQDEDLPDPMTDTKTCITLQGSNLHVMVVDYKSNSRADVKLPHTNSDNTRLDFTLIQDMIEKANGEITGSGNATKEKTNVTC